MKRDKLRKKMPYLGRASSMLLLLLLGCYLTLPVIGQTKAATIKGLIQSEKGEPLNGVSVELKAENVNHATQTNEDGVFIFENLDASLKYNLQFKHVGYELKALKNYALKQGITNSIIVKLKESNNDLSEIVVVGYGKQKKVNLSGAVQSVSSKELESRPINSVGAGLEGLIPNLNITPNSGRPTDAPAFNVRGYTSLTGGDAFILVDNVPVRPDELTRLNPADVESVSVLKDAAASAIYGARAAFGVVLITTKTAKSEKLQVTADFNYAVRNAGSLPKIVTDPLTVMQYKHDAATPLYDLYPDAVREYAAKRSKDPSLPAVIVDPTDPNKWAYYGSTNWMDEAYRKSAPAYTGNVSLSQKTNKLSYYMSAGYYQQDGLLRYGTDIYNRYNLRGNGTYQVTKWFKLGTNTTFTVSKYDMPTYNSSYLYFHNVNRTPSLSVPRNPDGTWTADGASLLGTLQDGGRTTTNTNDVLANINAEISLIKDTWTVKGEASYRRTNATTNGFNVPVAYRNGPNQPLGYTYSADGGNTSWAKNEEGAINYNVYNVYTDFHKTFAQKHFLQALAGFNQEYWYRNYFWVQRNNLISTSIPNTQVATGTITQGSTITDWAVRGLFYRLNYIFDNKYIVELNGRYDGTSRFPSNDRWGFFPSASGAWVVSKENFFQGISRSINMDFFKLRASYGSLGNQALNANQYNNPANVYPYIPSMPAGQIGSVLDGQRPIGVSQPAVVSPTLTWETVKTVNFGTDMSFFNNRLELNYDWYTRYTEGMLTKSKTLPGTFGAAEPQTNAANLKTKGWELTASWRDQFKLASSPFLYSLRFTLGDSKAFITKYDNPNKILSDYYEGMQIGEVWGLTTDGFFQSDEEIQKHADQTAVGSDDQQYKFYVGDLKFKDINNDGKVDYGNNTVSNPGDRKIIGNNAPHYNYSFQFTGDYKGFDLRVFAQGIGKRDWYPNASNHYFWGIYAQPWTNIQEHNLDHWTPETPNGYFPRVKSYIAEDASELGAPQTRYLQNAAYLRLKNLTIGYSLPLSLTQKWKINKLRFYVSAENLFTIKHLKANLDPEGLDGTVYPFQKTYSLGLNLNF